MKKTIFLVLVAVVLFLAAMGTFQALNGNKSVRAEESNTAKPRFISVDCDILQYTDVKDLYNNADLVVIGTPEKDFFEYATTVPFSDGKNGDFYTVTDFKVSKLAKGVIDTKTIKVKEPAGKVGVAYGNKDDIMILEGYTVLRKANKYILFLKGTDQGYYSLMSAGQGKFNLDGKDTAEMLIEKQSNQFKNLRESVLKRFAEECN